MSKYYVSKNINEDGRHEVHNQRCRTLPPMDELICLGDFKICSDAMIASRNIYEKVNGCYNCCFPCHKKFPI